MRGDMDSMEKAWCEAEQLGRLCSPLSLLVVGLKGFQAQGCLVQLEVL